MFLWENGPSITHDCLDLHKVYRVILFSKNFPRFFSNNINFSKSYPIISPHNIKTFPHKIFTGQLLPQLTQFLCCHLFFSSKPAKPTPFWFFSNFFFLHLLIFLPCFFKHFSSYSFVFCYFFRSPKIFFPLLTGHYFIGCSAIFFSQQIITVGPSKTDSIKSLLYVV